MVKTSKYIYPKMNKARSYRDEVIRRLEVMKTQGALLELKEYTSRAPSKYLDRFDIDNPYLRSSESIFVVILSGPKKQIVNATLVGKEVWYKTIKTADRYDADEMLAHVDNLLKPLQEYVDERSRSTRSRS